MFWVFLFISDLQERMLYFGLIYVVPRVTVGWIEERIRDGVVL